MANNDKPIAHRNHKKETFYLHFTPARRGKPDRYYFLETIEPNAIFQMPDGYRINEDEDGVLTLVRK